MKKNMFFYSVLGLLSSSMGFSQAVPRLRPYDVQNYRLQLSLDPTLDPQTFRASVEMKFKALAPLKELELDASELQIHSAAFLGKSGEVAIDTQAPQLLKVRFTKPMKTGEIRILRIGYTAQIRSSHNGMFRVVDPDEPQRGPLYFTHLEPTEARKLFPCNDEPHDKATTEVVATVPAGYQVLANGEKISEKKTLQKGAAWTRFHWSLPRPHPTYLVALAIGKFSKIATKAGNKELSVWVGSTKTEKARYALEVTKKSYEFLEKYLGVPYPWSKYATVGVPTFLWGGMENTSSTHMNEERACLNDPHSEIEKKRIVNLAAHELAHQWFGDFVTMKWWDDVWLNESFATLMGTLATESVYQNTESQIETITNAWDDYFRQEDGPRSHPIVDKNLNSIDDAFDSINYTKGANVLRMLSFYVGEENFRKGVKTYLEKAAYSNATHEDFFHSMENVTQMDLSHFQKSWLLSRGYPVLTYAGKWDDKKKTYTLLLKQKPNHPEDGTVFDFKIPVAFHRKGEPSYSRTVAISVSKAETETSVVLAAEPDWVTVNPGSSVLAIWAPEDLREEILAKQATLDPDEITRVWAAFKLLSPLHEGKDDPSKIGERTVLKLLEEDPSPYVRNAVLVHLQTGKAKWLSEKLGNGILALARKAANEVFAKNAFFDQDPHGWRLYRSELLGVLGKVNSKEVLPFLEATLKKTDLPLDDLGKTAQSVAFLGEEKGAEILKSALTLHQPRGYRYRFLVQYAFGAYENPKAAQEIGRLANEAGSDLMGRIGNLVSDNMTLKTSKEWSAFLKEFTLKNDRFGDEVKARILTTIEEVKQDHVKALLEAVHKESSSERLKEVSRKILSKNFKG